MPVEGHLIPAAKRGGAPYADDQVERAGLPSVSGHSGDGGGTLHVAAAYGCIELADAA